MKNSSNLKVLEALITTRLAQQTHACTMPKSPEFPLAFNANMPEGHAFPHGDVHIAFSEMEVSGVQDINVDTLIEDKGNGSYQLKISFPSISIRGNYTVSSQYAKNITMDTGGDMFDESISNHQPAGANTGNVDPFTPDQKSAMLDQARKQKTHLRETANGQALLSTFNDHNETFNTVFVTSDAARIAWAADGVTKAMALDTHTTLTLDEKDNNNEKPINSKDKQYAPNVTYNSNSFNQQLQIIVNTVAADPNFNPYDPKAKLDPNSKYVKASLAAMTFGYSVNNTGNDKKNTKELSSSKIYDHVKTQTPPQDATVAELQNIIDQGAGTGGAVEQATKKKWRILDEEDRGKVRYFLFQALQEKLLKKNTKPEPLWSGDCRASIPDVTAALSLSKEPCQQKLRIDSTQIDIPAFSLDINDAQWNGDLGQHTRERLNQIFFIKRLLHDKLQQAISDFIQPSIAELQPSLLQDASQGK